MIRLCAFSDEAGGDMREQADSLLRNGITMTELRSADGVNIAHWDESFARQAKAELDRRGISVWSLGTGFGKTALNDDFSETDTFSLLSHLLGLAEIFECRRMRIFSFYESHEKKDRVFELLGKAVRMASERGIGLYHENEKGIYGDSCERVTELLDNVPGLGSVYDPANFIQCGELPEKTLPALHGRADYFHIKDIISSTGEIVPAGHGDAEIAKLISMISEDAVLTLEPHLASFKGYAEIDRETLKNKYIFKDQGEAFDTAAAALKDSLARAGYREERGGYVKWKQV